MMKLFTLLSAALTAGCTTVVASRKHSDLIHRENTIGRSLQQCATVYVGAETPLELTLETGGSNCFLILATDTDNETGSTVKLTIRNTVYGRYGISLGNSGYSWNEPADGIYYLLGLPYLLTYCASLGDVLTFDEFPTADNDTPLVVTISAELVPEYGNCNSDYISFNGFEPIETPVNNGVTTAVSWCSHRYCLNAAHFEYTTKANGEVVTFKGAKNFDIRGDPGDDGYHSIEITWYDEAGKERRFYGYIGSSGNKFWDMFEARVYDDSGEWVEFYPDGLISGEKESCFKADRLVITNDDGDVIEFEQMTLAAFLPWSDEEKMLDCVKGSDSTTDATTTGPTTKATVGATSAGVIATGVTTTGTVATEAAAQAGATESTQPSVLTTEVNNDTTGNKSADATENEDLLHDTSVGMRHTFGILVVFVAMQLTMVFRI